MIDVSLHVLSPLSTVNGVPPRSGVVRHLKLVVADGIGDGVDDGGGRADRAASPHPLTPSGLPGHSVVVCDS